MNRSYNPEFKSYLKELKNLRKKGIRLYYPYDKEISPRKIAEEIAYKRGVTCMRDPQFDKEGRMKSIRFTRVEDDIL